MEHKTIVNRNEAILTSKDELENQLLADAVLHLNGNILGIVLGIVLGFIIFSTTNFLILRGGNDVGVHLNLLSHFFIGYSVTFVGSLIGTVYGFVTGFIVGYLTAWIYNRIIIFKSKT